jgi:neutral ceramidase
MAANRRHHREGCAELPQLVDHEVPVLAVYGSGVRDGVSALRAVVFGYSCHATCTDDGTIHGDYPGFAQAEIEHAHEVDATVALFLNGCGADQGPLPRFRPGLDEMYGKILAAAVEDVLVRRTLPNGDEAGGTLPVVGPLHCSCGVADVPLEPPPSREELEAAARGGDPAGDGTDGKAAPCAGPAHLAGAAWQQTSVAQRSALYQLEKLDRGECLSSSVGIRLNAWRFGGGGGSGGEGKSARGGGGGGGADPRPLTLVAGSGEWCVDYSLRLKRELGADSTWVSSYNNELVAYVPSGRVRREGGMEGGEAMLEYRHPSWFVPEVEEVIVGKVHELVEALDGRMPQEST